MSFIRDWSKVLNETREVKKLDRIYRTPFQNKNTNREQTVFEDVVDELIDALEELGFEDYAITEDEDGNSQLDLYCEYLTKEDIDDLIEEAKTLNLGIEFSADNDTLVVVFYFNEEDATFA